MGKREAPGHEYSPALEGVLRGNSYEGDIVAKSNVPRPWLRNYAHIPGGSDHYAFEGSYPFRSVKTISGLLPYC